MLGLTCLCQASSPSCTPALVPLWCCSVQEAEFECVL